MAKAILGHLNTFDPRVVASLSAENRRLRQRVADLEEHVRRLQLENDGLAAAAVDRATLLGVPEQMQPA